MLRPQRGAPRVINAHNRRTNSFQETTQSMNWKHLMRKLDSIVSGGEKMQCEYEHKQGRALVGIQMKMLSPYRHDRF